MSDSTPKEPYESAIPLSEESLDAVSGGGGISVRSGTIQPTTTSSSTTTTTTTSTTPKSASFDPVIVKF